MTNELSDNTLAFAQDAQTSVSALVELLRGCPPDYSISAGLLVGLLVSVQQQLEVVVDDLGVSLPHGSALVLPREVERGQRE